MNVVSVPRPGLVTGAAAIVLAEVLISRRWFFTGVEAALWIGGVFALISELPRSGTPESMLVLAAASGIAGARVRNPLFGALAAVFVMLYFEKRLDAGVLCTLLIALASCIACCALAPAVDGRALDRARAGDAVRGAFHRGREWRTVTIALYAIFGVMALVLAIARRHHALFLSAHDRARDRGRRCRRTDRGTAGSEVRRRRVRAARHRVRDLARAPRSHARLRAHPMHSRLSTTQWSSAPR